MIKLGLESQPYQFFKYAKLSFLLTFMYCFLNYISDLKNNWSEIVREMEIEKVCKLEDWSDQLELSSPLQGYLVVKGSPDRILQHSLGINISLVT
jgi:hypothetical protein